MNTPITYKEYQEALAICNNYLRQEKDVSLIEVDMSVSLHKCLEILLRLNQVENIHTITLRYFTDNYSLKELQQHMGRKSLSELEDIFKEHNIVWSKKYENTSSQK